MISTLFSLSLFFSFSLFLSFNLSLSLSFSLSLSLSFCLSLSLSLSLSISLGKMFSKLKSKSVLMVQVREFQFGAGRGYTTLKSSKPPYLPLVLIALEYVKKLCSGKYILIILILYINVLIFQQKPKCGRSCNMYCVIQYRRKFIILDIKRISQLMMKYQL